MIKFLRSLGITSDVADGHRTPGEARACQPRTGHATDPNGARNLRRGHYDMATDLPDRHRLRIAFDDLAITI